MKKRAARRVKKNKLEYPAETPGSGLAAELREDCNKLTREQRQELFKQGMRVYYGGSWPKEATRS